MIMLFLYSLAPAAIACLLLRNKGSRLRYGVSIALWLGLPVLFLVYVLIIGDQMPPDAVIIAPAPPADR